MLMSAETYHDYSEAAALFAAESTLTEMSKVALLL